MRSKQLLLEVNLFKVVKCVIDTKEFEKEIDVTYVEQPQQVMIINGVRQAITRKNVALKCPTCGELLLTVEQATTLAMFYEMLANGVEVPINRCSSCGQKLTIHSAIEVLTSEHK